LKGHICEYLKKRLKKSRAARRPMRCARARALAAVGVEMATGTRSPSTRRVLLDKEAGMR
jgi:hypothetical protein